MYDVAVNLETSIVVGGFKNLESLIVKLKLLALCDNPSINNISKLSAIYETLAVFIYKNMHFKLGCSGLEQGIPYPFSAFENTSVSLITIIAFTLSIFYVPEFHLGIFILIYPFTGT